MTRRTDPSFGDAVASEDLQTRSVRGGAVRLVAQAFQSVVAVAAGIILARVLAPSDFGVFAMAFTVVGFVSWFRDFGLPLALTQRDELSEAAAHSVFQVGLKLTVGVSIALLASAPAVAAFYDEPQVSRAM